MKRGERGSWDIWDLGFCVESFFLSCRIEGRLEKSPTRPLMHNELRLSLQHFLLDCNLR